MSIQTEANFSGESYIEMKSTVDKFYEKFGYDRGSSATGIMGKALVAGIIFDWPQWVEDQDLDFDRDSFTENPTMVTGREMGESDPIETYLFSSGGNRSYFSAEYVDKMSDILGYNIKANLDKLYMDDSENSLLIAEGDGFDAVIAHRIPPSDI